MTFLSPNKECLAALIAKIRVSRFSRKTNLQFEFVWVGGDLRRRFGQLICLTITSKSMRNTVLDFNWARRTQGLFY